MISVGVGVGIGEYYRRIKPAIKGLAKGQRAIVRVTSLRNRLVRYTVLGYPKLLNSCLYEDRFLVEFERVNGADAER